MRSKTYKDYLKYREEQLKKGYELKEEMDEGAFQQYYDILKENRRLGNINTSAWNELKRKERYISEKQSKILRQAYELKYGEKTTLQRIKKASKAEIEELGLFINATKQTGIYGGDYE